MESKEIYDQVNKRYGSIDKSSTGQYEQTVAKAFGYTEEELAAIPEGANLGLSCGNPLALAKLRDVCVAIPYAGLGANLPREKPLSTLDLVLASMSSLPQKGSVRLARQLVLT
jgi:hypothetical protein